MNRVNVAIAIIVRNGDILIAQRPPTGHFAGCWEFPGGKLEPGESIEQCLEREVMEEVHLRIRPRRPLPVIEHDYPQVRIRLHPFLCDCDDDKPECRAVQTTRWVPPAALRDYNFPPANDPLIEQLIRELP